MGQQIMGSKMGKNPSTPVINRSTRAFGSDGAELNPWYPRLLGTRGAIACEHYLAAQTGADILKSGGNAIDAAVGATFVEGVVNPHMYTLGGECPMLIYLAKSGKVVAVNGNTAAPGLATVEALRRRGYTEVPAEGILAAGVPAAFGALLFALSEFGRLAFEDVITSALYLARNGFPVHRGLIHQPRFGIHDLQTQFRHQWSASAALYLPDDQVPEEGQILRNPALADLFDALVNTEQSTSGKRRQKLQAVRDAFYRGDVASEIDRFSCAHAGLLRRADMERFETRLEKPVSLDFYHSSVFKCGPWNQGPVMLQALAILKHFNLAALGHNSADYLHTLIETVKLAFADREQYYADPHYVEVPLVQLLSDKYAKLRSTLIDSVCANSEIRPGDPLNGRSVLPVTQRLGGEAWGPGTVHVDVIDGHGNMVAFTPSGAWIKSSEVIPALGFPLTARLMTFYLEPAHHPNLLAPFKRPRTTISPSLAFHNGRPWMVFGSMGGDQQDQWQLQFLLNRVLFNMSIQKAIEAPKFSSEHFPGFFAPHDFFPNRVRIEPRIARTVLNELTRRGHELEVAVDWTEGYLLAAGRDPDTGVLEAGCDPRGTKGDVFPAYALCW